MFPVVVVTFSQISSFRQDLLQPHNCDSNAYGTWGHAEGAVFYYRFE